jgi:hypothetical protein
MIIKESDNDVSFEVAKKDDNTLWTCSVSCPAALSEKEFACALMTLAEDMLEGRVDFESAPEVDVN